MSASTIYHIYHSGPGCRSTDYVAYTSPDSFVKTLHPEAKILDPMSCAYFRYRVRMFWSSEHPSKPSKRVMNEENDKKDEKNRKESVVIILDDPTTDPRVPSYYLACPNRYRAWLKLQFGGQEKVLTKQWNDGKEVARIKSVFGWRWYQIFFTLSEEEVNEDRESEMKDITKIGITEVKTEKMEEEGNLSDKYKESLRMNWTRFLRTREYGFRYHNVEYRWKGTSQVSDHNKLWGRCARFCHLKLVAYLPSSSNSQSNDHSSCFSEGAKALKEGAINSYREVLVAQYTCLVSMRKAGRLEVFDEALKQCGEEREVRDMIVATALCMVQAERGKRKSMRRLLQVGGDIGGSC